MKKISILTCLVFVALFSCEKDETIVVMKSDAAPPQITSPASTTDVVVTQATLGNELDINWSNTDYGVTTEVTYTVEVDSKCNSFEHPIVIGVAKSNSLSLTLESLNAKLLTDMKLAPNQRSELQLRVKSVINDKYLSVSDIIPITATPWSDKPNALWLGENAASAPQVLATAESVYEGYNQLIEGTSFRFSNNPVCANDVFGASGDNTLSAETSSSPVTITTTGYYKVKVDTEALTYETTLISTWGMIGTSTPNGWNSSTPMVYDAANNIWQASLALTAGALKFRANNDWGINYGPADPDDLGGTLTETNDAISIPESGNYIVTVDFSRSKAPYEYQYSVVKNSNIPEPLKLWLPGSYQNWSPSTAPTIYAISTNEYEGYVYINTGAGFKFTTAPDWDHINYGYSGTPGLLTTDGLKDGLSLSTGGYYRFKVNTSTLAYTIDLVNSWGLIGTATSGGWDNSTVMTYDQANDVWKVTTNLAEGALKFRANNGWEINYGVGDINALQGNMVFDAPSINIAEAGSYTVILDFSRSESPYQYTYKVTKN